MGIFVNDYDFGDQTKFELATGIYSNQKINKYIERYEKDYLIDLFGVELCELFYADTPGSQPLTDKYLKLYKPFYEQIGFSLMKSKGIKDMLTGFIYFEYAKDLITETTPVGMVKPQEQNSKVISAHTPIYLKYNESIKTYNAIQEYIMLNMNEYPEFRGRIKQYAYWL